MSGGEFIDTNPTAKQALPDERERPDALDRRQSRLGLDRGAATV